MFRISPRLRTAAAVLILGMGLAACTNAGHTTNFQGSPPLSAVPNKVKNFTDPYLAHIGTGVYGAALLLSPNFLPGRCEGLYMTGDRALVCDQIERLNGEPTVKTDPNARFRCFRTLGGTTECTEVTAKPAETTPP